MSTGHSPAAVRLTAAEVYPEPAILGGRVSPDGNTIGFIHRSSHQFRVEHEKLASRALADLWLIPAAGGPAQPVFGPTESITAFAWSPVSATTLAVYRAEVATLTIHELGEPTGRVIHRGKLHRPRLDRGEGDLAEPRWSPDGTRLLIATHEGAEHHLIELAADGRQTRRLLSTAGAPVCWDWSPDGRQVVAIVSQLDATIADLLVIDLASGEVRQLGEERHTQYRTPIVRWSPTGELILRSNRSDWSKLWAVDPSTGAARAITEGAWDEAGFQLAPDGRILAASSREQTGLGLDLWLIDPAGGAARRVTSHPGVNAPLGWAGDRAVYWHADGRGESDIWTQPAAGGDPMRLTSTAPIANLARLRAPEEVVIPTPHGSITGLLHRPADAAAGERFPGVIWVHGGPASTVRPIWSAMAGFCHLLANEGFLVLNVNYRGSTGHGVPHMNAVSGDGIGANDLADIVTAAEFLRAHPEADSTRGVGIAGRSWGGYISLMALTTQPEVFSCGFAGAAVSDWEFQQVETDVRYYDYWLLGGWSYHQPELIAARSPITHVERLQAPLLVTHGEADPNVPPEQMRVFVERARAAGKQVETRWYPYEEHIMALRDNQQDELERMVRFFRRWLHQWDFVDTPRGGQVSA